MITYVLDLLHKFVEQQADKDDFEAQMHDIVQRHTQPVLEAFYIEM